MNKNVLIICSDEMRGDCAGYMGNPDIQTPNLDALSKESIVFERFMTVFPKCVPARVSMMTGRYSHTDGVRSVSQHMDEERINLLDRFCEHGYQTALFGKNHCWSPKTVEECFDYTSHSADYIDRMNETPEVRMGTPLPGGAVPLKLEDGWDYLGCGSRHVKDEVYTEQAIDFIEHRRDERRPFFMQVNLESPHTLYGVEEPWFSMYKRQDIRVFPYQLPVNAPLPLVKQREHRTGMMDNEQAVREIQSIYYGMISKVDMQVGQIIDALRKQNLMDNTIIMFWSDHGDFAGQYGLVEKWDTCFQDCLLHVPMMLRVPGLPAARVQTLGDTTDIAPTLCELLGFVPIPGMHGVSQLPAIHGKKVREAVFANGGHELSMRRRAASELVSGQAVKSGLTLRPAKAETYKFCPETMARCKMVRTERYKLVMRETGEHEWYDLQDDPYEMNNRWGEAGFDKDVMKLMQLLLGWCLRTDTDEPYLSKFTV